MSLASDPRATGPRFPAGASRRGVYLWNTGLAVVIAAVMVLFAGWGRPLWIDEVLHFATGAMSWTDLLRTIDYTTIEINHGQTGVYFVVDWVLLQVVGANSFFLRLPSLLSLLLLLVSAVFIIRLRQLGRLWEFVVLVSLLAHSTLMAFGAEARPYMPLVASAVMMVLLFMSSPEGSTPSTYRSLGIFGMFLGAIMHAYWPLFLLFAVVFGVLVQYLDGRRWTSVRKVGQSVSIFWVLGAALVYFVVGQLSWMRKSSKFDYDPLQWLGPPGQAIQSFFRLHFLLDIPFIIWGVLGGTTVMSIVVCRRGLRSLIAPLFLTFGGVATSLALSAVSVSRGYWIFERQWVAGIALCSIGFVWFFGELWRLGSQRTPAVRLAPGLFILMITWAAVASVTQAFAAHQSWNEQQMVFSTEQRSVEELFVNADDQAVVYAANVNVSRGGPVWPQFTDWYRGQAGMRSEFREANPSWTQWLWGQDRWSSD